MCKWKFTILPSSTTEKESGAEGEEDIGDSQEPLLTIPKLNMIIVNFILLCGYGFSNLCTISFLLLHYYVHEYYILVL